MEMRKTSYWLLQCCSASYHVTVDFLPNNLLITEAIRHHIKILKELNVNKNDIRRIEFVNEIRLSIFIICFEKILGSYVRGLFRTQSKI